MRFRTAFYTLVFLLCFDPARAGNELVLVTTTAAPLHNSDNTGFLDLILKEAYGRIGVKVKFIELPGERAMVNVNKGIDDGEMVRIGGLERSYPNIVAVPEKILDIDFVVFAKRKDISVNSWNDLRPYSVAYLRGWKIFDYNVPDSVRVTMVEDVNHMFELLVNDKIDIVLLDRWMGVAYLLDNGITGVRVWEQPLVKKKMYTYLHKKHKNLVPKVAAALREMKADGTYQRYFDQVFGSLKSYREPSR